MWTIMSSLGEGQNENKQACIMKVFLHRKEGKDSGSDVE